MPMLKIKLTPVGKINHRQYRVVVAADREKLTGSIIAHLGSYDPHQTVDQLKIDRVLYQSWLTKGAQPTPTVKSLVSKLK